MLLKLHFVFERSVYRGHARQTHHRRCRYIILCLRAYIHIIILENPFTLMTRMKKCPLGIFFQTKKTLFGLYMHMRAHTHTHTHAHTHTFTSNIA